jgi:hypothetical protein
VFDMSAKIEIDFSEFERYQWQLEELAGGEAVEQAIDDALQQTQQLIADNVDAAMSKHIQTGETKRSIIRDNSVEWTGSVASVDVGFRISDGGFASIFLMYGTTVHGQPHVAPDRNLYNAVYGSKVRNQIKQIQQEAFEKAIERVMK